MITFIWLEIAEKIYPQYVGLGTFISICCFTLAAFLADVSLLLFLVFKGLELFFSYL